MGLISAVFCLGLGHRLLMAYAARTREQVTPAGSQHGVQLIDVILHIYGPMFYSSNFSQISQLYIPAIEPPLHGVLAEV